MNKLQLIDIIAEENEITKSMAGKVVNSMITHIMEAVKNGEMVLLVGFGTFRTIVRKTKNTDKNGNPLPLQKAKRTPKFIAGSHFKKIVNETEEDKENSQAVDR